MQDHEHEREQDPASRSGDEETRAFGTTGEAPADWTGGHEPPAYGPGSQDTPTYGTGSQQPPAYGTSQNTPTYEPSQDTPVYGPSQDTPAYGPSQNTPTYGPSQDTPAYGPSQDTPTYGADSQGHEVPGTDRDQPGYGASSQQTDAFWVSNQTALLRGRERAAAGLRSRKPAAAGLRSRKPAATLLRSRKPAATLLRGGSQQPPGYGAGSQQPPGYGAGSQQPPPYPGSWQPSGAGNWPPPPGSAFGQWGTPPQPPNRRGRRALAFAVVAILGVGIGAGAAFGIANNSSQQSASSPGAQAVPTPGSQRAPLQNTGTNKINVQGIDDAVSPSVADITSRLSYTNETAEGTGIVLNSSGLILTNNHVVNGATKVTAQIDGKGTTYTARILGTDKTDDVALLQLQGASGLKPAPIGDSSKVVVGDQVVALGNQGGQGGPPTATNGAITNVNRTITAGDQGSADTETLHGMLQTDAYIAAGDSGGPLVNASGQVIGMDTAAASNGGFGQSSNSSQGGNIGFAIPINHALSIAREIAAGHSSSTIQIGARGFLGVGVQDISTGCGSSPGNFGPGGGFDGGSTAPVNSGALVCDVYPGTPAQSAGVATGDVITGVNGTTVTSAQSLTNAMQSKRPGNQVSLTWVDASGQSHTATLTLVAGPAE